MPLCDICGSFEPELYPQALCKECFAQNLKTPLFSSDLIKIRKTLNDTIHFSHLSYPEHIAPQQTIQTNFSFQTRVERRATMQHNHLHPNNPQNIIPHKYSKMALFLSFIGALIPFAGIIIEIIAIVIAIYSIKVESTNWMQITAIILAIFAIFMQIITLIYIDSFYQIMSDINLSE